MVLYGYSFLNLQVKLHNQIEINTILSTTFTSMNSVLSRLKVVEVASVLAGPAVGMYFAERGATVIKVENKTSGGDVTRSWKLPSESKEKKDSAYFNSVNWGKKHVFLDFNDPSDLSNLNELMADADIVLTNFKKGDAAKFGLDFKTLSQHSPSIILGEISGYGFDSDRVAFDLILQADAGFMSMNGTSESGPVKMPVAFIDLFAAHQMKEGLLEALLEQKENPGAYQVRVSLFDAAVASLANQATNYLIAGHVPQRMGSKHPNIAPYGELFPTKDNRQLTLAVGSDKQFEKLSNYFQLDIHQKFPTNQARVENRAEIEQSLAVVIKDKIAQEIEHDLIQLNIPVAVINDLEQLFKKEETQQLLLENEAGKRVKTVAYNIQKA